MHQGATLGSWKHQGRQLLGDGIIFLGQSFLHERLNLARDVDIDLHPGADDDGVGAKVEGLEHRHGRADAVDPCDIAGRRNNPPPPSAYDDGQVCKGRVIPLFDGGVEAVAIHMGDGEGEELSV